MNVGQSTAGKHRLCRLGLVSKNRPVYNRLPETVPWDTLRVYTSIAVSINLKTNTNPNPDPNRYWRRCPDPNARIQETEELQIKMENTNLRLRKYERCIFLILPRRNCKVN